MSQFSTDSHTPDAQINAFKRYGGYIVAAILLALLGYFGWTYWQSNYNRVDTAAADQYADIQQLNNEIILLSQNPDLDSEAKKRLADNQATLDQDITTLVASHKESVYAWQALLIKARQQADAGSFKSASSTLKQALAIDLQDAGLKAITQLRYARTLLAAGEAKAAASVLDAEMPGSFEASKQELLGDIQLAQGDKKRAMQSYKNAWELLRGRQENRAVLGVKLESLGMVVEPIDPPDQLVSAPSMPTPMTSEAVDSDEVDTDISEVQDIDDPL